MKLLNLLGIIALFLLFSTNLFSQGKQYVKDDKRNPSSWKLQLTDKEANDLLFGHFFSADLNSRYENLNSWSSCYQEYLDVKNLPALYKDLSESDKLKFKEYENLLKAKSLKLIAETLDNNSYHPGQKEVLDAYLLQLNK